MEVPTGGGQSDQKKYKKTDDDPSIHETSPHVLWTMV